MKALLLRVGIDKGTDGALGPIFSDGSFEYIPISEDDFESIESRTFHNTIGRHGKPFSHYLPSSIKGRKLHYDPEFETFTYGDPTRKRNSLLKLEQGDLLVFYAGLTPFNNFEKEAGLYIIGYFTVDQIFDFNELTDKEIEMCSIKYSNNAHLKRKYELTDLVIVTGNNEKSKLLDSGVLISRVKKDKRGRPYYAVSEYMESTLGISGSIQRSATPRLIYNIHNVNNIKILLNI